MSVVRGAARIQGLTWQPVASPAPIITGLDLHIEPGERVLLVGPSGAGKSTILHALIGALGTGVPGDVSGIIEVQGRAGLLRQDPTDSFVADRIGREIAFGPENLGLPREEIHRRVAQARRAVALPYGPDRPVAALSGGEAQRLSLAGVLAMRPDLLLLDEPTAMLDEAHAEQVRRAVDDVVRSNQSTLVVVEHRIEPWLDLVDRVIAIDAGAVVVADGRPDVVMAAEGERLAAEGVWVPGFAAPEPWDVPAELVTPAAECERVRVEQLTVDLVRRGLRSTTRTRALDAVDARFDAGRITALVGPSGAGKSTLLAALGGLVAPTAGIVHGFGRPPHLLSAERVAMLSGWVPQTPAHGVVTKRVGDEVALTARRLGRSVDVAGIAEVMGLSALVDRHPHRLSGGEQRRLAVASALAHRPAVCLLDEPTVGQDRGTWSAVAGWMRSAARAGAVVATATHDGLLAELADDLVGISGRTGQDVACEPS